MLLWRPHQRDDVIKVIMTMRSPSLYHYGCQHQDDTITMSIWWYHHHDVSTMVSSLCYSHNLWWSLSQLFPIWEQVTQIITTIIIIRITTWMTMMIVMMVESNEDVIVRKFWSATYHRLWLSFKHYDLQMDCVIMELSYHDTMMVQLIFEIIVRLMLF